MIRKMMERIYEGFTDALWRLGFFFEVFGSGLVYIALAITVPLWALPYRWYRNRRDR